ncbi:unnamed protein product [Effrenium voratum]|nr:unnamed protein product [Effrenium voratum]
MARAELLVLMVAEKPSIAATLAQALGPPNATKRRGMSPSSPVHEYSGAFLGQPARFRVTATTGHVYSLDFSQEYNNWDKFSPDELFTAKIVRTYDPRSNIPAHITEEARNCDLLVLWLDCDREGENICFEVMELALPQMKEPRAGAHLGAYRGCVYRARFSSLAPQDLQAAMDQLAQPNQNESLSVDARQELDLRVGVAFSRLQTMYFRKHFGRQLGKQMVTYGPCQIPTLWFCVHRHVEIEAFRPEPYWRLSAVLPAGHSSFQAQYQAGQIWNEGEARALLARARAATEAKVLRQRAWSSSYARPRPLNTVEMLKMASEVLGLGPDDALHVAESLYLKGILSYPRTETDKYPENFDLRETVRSMAQPGLPWVEFAQQLLTKGLSQPREDGHDVGDHPPITPIRAATQSQCGSEAAWALYEEVCRHFLATISPDSTFREAELVLQVGDLSLSATSRRVLHRGWAAVAQVQLKDIGAVDLSSGFREGETLALQDVSLSQHFTQPPQHLTESELLALMDRHGIGTDASMASHVGNVQKRKYVQLDAQTRQMRPSELGLALCHSYMLIDPELVLPTVRASIENACARVARGEARKPHVVEHSLRTFKNKFYGFARQIDRVPLMLALAYSLSGPAGGMSQGRAGQSLGLWHEAAARTARVSLEDLLSLRDEAMVSETPEGAFDLQQVLADNPAVRQVQAALEELGFSAEGPEHAPAPEGDRGHRGGKRKGGKGGKGSKGASSKGKGKGKGGDAGWYQ